MKLQHQIKRGLLFTLIFSLLASYIYVAQAQSSGPGSLDPSFSGDGKVTTIINQTDTALDVLIQSDGKIIAVGTSMVRYNPDGSLDNTFGTGGIALGDINNGDVVTSAALQQNGKIVVAGYALGTGVGGDNADFGLVRFNSDGSIDSTFGNGGKVTTNFFNFNDVVSGIALQPDGNIVVGVIVATGTAETIAVARYIGDTVNASPVDLINALIDLVESFNIKQGIENSLDAKLENALRALDAAQNGDTTTACNSINAFINEVNAQSGKALTVAQANQLIAAAQQIRAALGCQ